MFEKIMNYIKEFLDYTPDDIYDFSCDLEGKLIQHYDEMHNEQLKATEILNDEMPDICATGEPGMKPEEIEEFKAKLRKEYERTLRYVV